MSALYSQFNEFLFWVCFFDVQELICVLEFKFIYSDLYVGDPKNNGNFSSSKINFSVYQDLPHLMQLHTTEYFYLSTTITMSMFLLPVGCIELFVQIVAISIVQEMTTMQMSMLLLVVVLENAPVGPVFYTWFIIGSVRVASTLLFSLGRPPLSFFLLPPSPFLFSFFSFSSPFPSSLLIFNQCDRYLN